MTRGLRLLAMAAVLMLTSQSLTSQGLSLGLRSGGFFTLGRGKGFWDWTDSSMEISREVVPQLHLAPLILWNVHPQLSLETTFYYSENICRIRADGNSYQYVQPSWEIPLWGRILLLDHSPSPYVKTGAVFYHLLDNASFEDVDDSSTTLIDSGPGQANHLGLSIGLGVQWVRNRNLLYTEFLYSTFYSSPSYKRSFGSPGDIGYHRFELSLGYAFKIY